MDEQSFRERLPADGYDEIVDRTFKAGTTIGDHSHTWDVRLLVVEGSLELGCNGASRIYRPGETFELERNVPHSEHYDDEGPTRVIVGRRHPQPRVNASSAA